MADYILQYRRRSRHHCPIGKLNYFNLSSHPNRFALYISVMHNSINMMRFIFKYGYLLGGVGEWWLSEGRHEGIQCNLTKRCPS